MILSATGDDRLNALRMQDVSSRIAAVPVIREKEIPMTARPAALTRNAGKSETAVNICPWAVASASEVWITSGVSFPSTTRVCFVPSVLRSNGAWTSGLAAESTDEDAINDRQFGFIDVSVAEPFEKVHVEHVEIVPHPGFVSSPKPSVGGAARTFEFERNVVPTAAGHQPVSDDLDHGAGRLPPSRPVGPFGGKQGLKLREKHIRHPSTRQSGPRDGSRRPWRARAQHKCRTRICRGVLTSFHSVFRTLNIHT